MTPLDPQAMLDTVDAGSAPDDWKVYRARKEYFLGWSATLWLLALIMCAVGVGVVALGILALTSSWSDPFRFFVLFLGLICGALATMYYWQGLVLLRQVSSASKQLLILTPDGFVVRTGPSQWLSAFDDAGIAPILPWNGVKGGRIYCAAYAEMVSADLSIWNTLFQARVRLIMAFVHPRRLVVWRVPRRFAYADTITQSIIEARARYDALHTEDQASRQPNGQD